VIRARRGPCIVCCVRRYFSAFPDGPPGFGLLLLRVVTALTAMVYGVARLGGTAGATLEAGGAALSIAAGAAVLVGIFTPGTALTLAAALAWLWFPFRADTLPSDMRMAVLTIANAVAIALLGPGAFSVDARLFGRREIVISRQPRP